MKHLSLAAISFLFSNLVYAQSSDMIDREIPGQHKYKINLKQMVGIEKTSRGTQGATSQFDAYVYLPVYQKEETTYAVSAKSQHLHFGNLPVKNNFVPITDLYSQQVSLSTAFIDAEKNTWKLSGGYGSASDKPFENSQSSVFDMNLSKKVQVDQLHSWTYFLNFSNNRGFLNNIPLPGFMYSTMNETMTQGAMFGIPFLTYWIRPTEKLTFTVFYLVPLTASVQASYNFTRFMQAGLKLSTGQQSFMRSDRQNKKDRIIYTSDRASASFKTNLSQSLVVELELVKAFNRSLFDGKDVTSLSSDRYELPEEDQGIASLNYSF